MGWNSWNKLGCNVDEKLIRGVADALVSTGMKHAGYKYLTLVQVIGTIPICWKSATGDD
jgi:hypothetical protein